MALSDSFTTPLTRTEFVILMKNWSLLDCSVETMYGAGDM
jgi:hypothetical protein